MKRKHYLVALVAIIALCSFTYSNKEGGEIPADAGQMRTLHYRGHSYVCYRFYCQESRKMPVDGCNNYSGAALIHDPDCKCGKGGR